MKKTMYYVMPLIIFSVLVSLVTFIGDRELIDHQYVWLGFYISLVLLSAIIGNFTPTHRNFDYIVTIIVPLSMFVNVFVLGHCDPAACYDRFTISRGISTAIQPEFLQIYLILALTTFLASFKPIRIVGIIRNIKRNK